MAVAKIIELNASSTKGLEDAIQVGLHKAATSVKGLQGAWIKEIKVVTDAEGNITEWRADMKVSFMVQ
ncbi:MULTISPECIES: dodecin family protein [unclassified Lysobacter]